MFLRTKRGKAVAKAEGERLKRAIADAREKELVRLRRVHRNEERRRAALSASARAALTPKSARSKAPPTELPEDVARRVELQLYFDMLDTDASGQLDEVELGALVRGALGHRMSDKKLRELVRSIDNDGSGQV